MAENPCVVTDDVTFEWDGAEQRLARGTIIDVPAGGPLEDAIGRGSLAPMSGPQADTAAGGGGGTGDETAPDAEQETATAPRAKTRRPAAGDDDSKGDASP
jgi:hypothetical protein